jgi:hypothetical protein
VPWFDALHPPTSGNPSDAMRGESTALEFKADSPEFFDLGRKKLHQNIP